MSENNPNAIRCIIIRIVGREGFCDGTVHESDTELEYRAFADGVREGAMVCDGMAGAYTKVSYGKLPPVGNEFIRRYLIEPMKGVKDE